MEITVHSYGGTRFHAPPQCICCYLSFAILPQPVGICSEGIEHRLGDVPGTTVGAVQTNLDALERVDTQRDQVAHVTVTARDVIHSTADMLTMSTRQFWPVLIEHIELAIDVILHQQQSLLRHFSP